MRISGWPSSNCRGMNEMSDKPIKILLVEDNPGDALLLRETLKEATSAWFEVEHVERLAEARKRLDKGGIDIVLLDLSLPDGHGLDTVRQVHHDAPDVPIVVLTALDDETLAVKAVGEGAQDYLVKNQIDSKSLERSIRYAIERGRVEKEVRSRTHELGVLFDIARILVQPESFEQKAAHVLEKLAQIAQADYAVLRRADEKGQGLVLVLVAVAGPARWKVLPPPLLDDSERISPTVFREGRLVVANDYQAHPHAVPRFIAPDLQSMVSLPIMASGRTLGVINVVSGEVNHFTPDRIRLLEAIGDGLGVLLENARLSEEITLNRELESRMSTFVSVASHQLRTPMTTIVGFTELLLQRKITEARRKEWLEHIYRDSQRLASIIDDLLNVSRIQSGKLAVNLENLPLQKALEEALSAIEPTTDRH